MRKRYFQGHSLDSERWGIVDHLGSVVMPCENALCVVRAQLDRLRNPASSGCDSKAYRPHKDNIAIARNFVLVRDARDRVIALNREGSLLAVKDAADGRKGMLLASWQDIRQVAAGFDHAIGLNSQGTLVSSGDTNEFSKSEEIERWRGVSLVDACQGHIAAVTTEGKILVATECTGYERPTDYRRELSAISNAQRVSVGWNHGAVLLADGTVKIVGNCDHASACSQWRNVVDIDVFGCYFSAEQTVGLTDCGRVLHSLDDSSPDSWRDMISVSCGGQYIVGLDNVGKVRACGRNDFGQCKVEDWPPMMCVRGDFFTTVGIDREGWIWMTPMGKTRHNVLHRTES